MRELDTRGLAFHSPVLQPHLGELKEGECSFWSPICLKMHLVCLTILHTNQRPFRQVLILRPDKWHFCMSKFHAPRAVLNNLLVCSSGGCCAKAQGQVCHMAVIHIRCG